MINKLFATSKFFIVTLIFFSSAGFSDNLRWPKNPVVFSGTPTATSIGGTKIDIFPFASVTLPTGEIAPLSLSGKGLRQKWVAIVKVNAYVGIHYLDDPSLLSATDPIGSLANTRTRMMVLHMLQNATANDIRAEFEDALDFNGVNLNSPEMSSLREQMTFSLNAGERAYLIGYHTEDDNDEHFYIDTKLKSIIEKGPALVSDFWRAWFGVSIDQEMANFKKALLSKAGKP